MGITGVEEAPQTCLAPVTDPLVGDGEQSAYPIQRIVIATPCPRFSFWTLRRT